MAASYGGGLGLKYAFHEPAIGAVAIFSLPFGDYGGVNLRPELTRNVRPELPLFFAYATEDVVAPAVRRLAPALDRLDRRRGRHCEVRSYPGKSHGNDLLHSHPELETYLIEWYLARLGR